MVPDVEQLPRFSMLEVATVPFEKPEVFYKFFFLYTKYNPIPVSTIR